MEAFVGGKEAKTESSDSAEVFAASPAVEVLLEGLRRLDRNAERKEDEVSLPLTNPEPSLPPVAAAPPPPPPPAATAAA